MTARKAIVALINNRIHIDPNDLPRVDMDKIQEQAAKTLGHAVEVVVAPINTWMPESGTKALMEEAMKPLMPSKRPIMATNKKNKHAKRYF